MMTPQQKLKREKGQLNRAIRDSKKLRKRTHNYCIFMGEGHHIKNCENLKKNLFVQFFPKNFLA